MENQEEKEKMPILKAGISNKAFTLLELIVVVVIISLVFFFAAPKFQDIAESSAESAIRRLKTIIEFQYDEAVFRKTNHRIYFDIKEGKYWTSYLTLDREGNLTPIKQETFTLPAGINFEDVDVVNRGKFMEGQIAYIELRPSGYADETFIHIKAGNNMQYTVYLHPYSGKVTVYEGYKQKKTNQ